MPNQANSEKIKVLLKKSWTCDHTITRSGAPLASHVRLDTQKNLETWKEKKKKEKEENRDSSVHIQSRTKKSIEDLTCLGRPLSHIIQIAALHTTHR